MLFSTGIATFGQANLPNSTVNTPKVNELSKERAVKVTKLFLSNSSLMYSQIPEHVGYTVYPTGQRICRIEKNGEYLADLDAVSGQTLFFDNLRRIHDQVHNAGRTGLRKFSRREDASAYLWNLARRLGLPANAYMVRLDVIDDNDPHHTDSNRTGSIGASFSVRPHGYEFLGEGNGMSLVLDPQDGVLTFFVQRWTVQIVSWTKKLTSQQSLQHAKISYSKYLTDKYGTEWQSSNLASLDVPKIGYVIPNELFYSGIISDATSRKARLAWAVSFGKDVVWVDAGNGKILGGQQYK